MVMSADVSGSYSEAPRATRSSGARAAVAACGIAVVLVAAFAGSRTPA
jgi:hypothetical protein